MKNLSHTPIRHPAFSIFFAFLYCFLCSFLSIPTATAQLSGTYTIGGVDGNYATFNEAIDTLETEGISGPVTFEVRPGTYEEQLTINSIPGSSCSNLISFRGAGSVPEEVVLQSTTASGFTVKVNGVEGLGFSHLSLVGGVETSPGADCFQLENNVVRGSVVAKSSADSRSNQHLYRNNHFQTGGIFIENEAHWNPAAPVFDQGLIIEGNELDGGGITITGQEGFIISQNKISVSDQEGNGISVYNSWYGQEISENSIGAVVKDYKGTGMLLNSGAAARITGNSIGYGDGGFAMDISTGKSQENEVLIANNILLVDGLDARGNYYDPIFNLVGLNITSNYANKVKIYHNTIHIGGQSEDVPNYALSLSGESNSFYILNNHFGNSAYGGKGLIINNPAVVAAMDYNNLYLDHTSLFAQWNGQEISSFSEWQTETGFDEHSISVSPTFPFNIPSEDMIGAGIYLEEVPMDHYGQERNDPPTIGAVEKELIRTPLSGIFTIGGEDPDFASFAEAFDSISSAGGIEDSIIFRVRPGVYSEQINIPTYVQAPKITIEGESGDSTDVVLKYPEENVLEPGGDVLVLNGTNNFTLRNVTIASGILIKGGSDLLFEYNIIHGGVNTSRSFQNTYRHNLFLKQGIDIRGPGWEDQGGVTHFWTSRGLIVEGNNFNIKEGPAIEVFAMNDVVVKDNYITLENEEATNGPSAILINSNLDIKAINNNFIVSHIPNSTGIKFAREIFPNDVALPREVSRNKIILMEGGTGISFSYDPLGAETNSAVSALVANNMISINAENGGTGLSINPLPGEMKFYHNTVNLYGDNSNSKALLFRFDSEDLLKVSFYNNIFANFAGGIVLDGTHSNGTDIELSADYNDLYTNGGSFGNWNGSIVANLNMWQIKTGFGGNSLAVDPVFHSTTELVPQNSILAKAGTAVPEVEQDYFGHSRGTPPSIGAVEFVVEDPTPLAGQYTIGGENPDFMTFSGAIWALESRGVSDSVIFKVSPGIYEEQLRLEEIPGLSCEIPVIFEGDNQDSTAVVLDPRGTGLLIEGADGITLRHMTIAHINITEGSNCITLENNFIRGNFFVTSGMGEEANDHHRYLNNFIRGGIVKEKEGVFDPSNPDFDEGLIISGNTIENSSENAIELIAQKEFTINDNQITINAERDGDAGISLTNSWYGKEIRRNDINIHSFYGQGAGIRTDNGFPERVSENSISLDEAENIENPYGEDEVALGGGTGIIVSTGKTSSGEVLIANNSIFVDGYDRSGMLGSLRGIHIKDNSEDQLLKVYHNSAAVTGYLSLEESAALFSEVAAAHSLEILNNVFSDDAYGYEVNIQHPEAVITTDYNFYGGITETNEFKWGNQTVNGLQSWQDITGMAEHSKTSGSLAGAGIKVEEVAFDIEGKPRPNPPAIGPVEPGNQPPVVSAGQNRSYTLPLDQFYLRGTGNDPDGRFTAFRWEKVSGPEVTLQHANTANALVTDLQPGEYIFRFSATDNDGATSSDEVNITIEPGEDVNQAPVVNAGRDDTITLPQSTYWLRGIAFDNDGRFVRFRWEQVSGPSITISGQNTANAQLSDLQPGTYVFRFSATDNDGATSSDELTITVEPAANQAPIITAGPDRIVNLPLDRLQLSGIGYDPDGRFTAFRWTKVSGPSVTMIQPNTANLILEDLLAGTYVFRFSATDNDGVTSSDEVTLTVRAEQLTASEVNRMSVSAYPNTFRNFVNVHIQAEEQAQYLLKVYDLMGREHYQNTFMHNHFNGGLHRIDLSDINLPEGVYLILIEDQTRGIRKTVKVVKKL